MTTTKEKLKKELAKRRKLIDIAKAYPLSVARLWRPHCHRWDGLAAESPRARGCGREMTRISAGLWHCTNCNIKEARTSQIEPFYNLGSEATLISGGNRAGKSEIMAQMAIAYAAGKREPWVQTWIELNGIPPESIPDKPGVIVVSGLSYGDALTYIRPKISALAPQGSIEKKWRAQDRAQLILPNGGKIMSLSADSGREKYQGFSANLIIMDEEHPLPLFEEAMLRVTDRKGSIVLTMTPLKGLTWVYDIFIDSPSPGFEHHKIFGLDNPWVSSVKMRKSVKHMSAESQASRLFGDFTNQQGLVYPEMKPNTHWVEPFEIPKDGMLLMGVDFGVVHPFAAIVCYYEARTDTLFVIDEYYKTEYSTIQNVNMIKSRFKDYMPFDYIICDPESKDARIIMSRMGLPNIPAPKHVGIVPSINYLKERLCLDADGQTHIKFFKGKLPNLMKEFRLYRWQESAARQAPIKRSDHGLDALRYLNVWLWRYLRHQ